MKRLLILLVAVLAVPALADNVVKAYPIHYELVQLTSTGQTVLAKGHAVLVPGRSEPLSQEQAPAPASGNRDTDITLHFTLDRSLGDEPGSPPHLILNTRARITKVSKTRKVEVPGKPDSYIRGPKENTITYSNKSWRAKGDPTPIVLPFTRDGHRYKLTVMFTDQPSG